MYTIIGILVLIVFTYIRPQEFVPAMEGFPWINLWLVLLFSGFAYDLAAVKIRREASPLLKWSLLFYGWCLFTLALREPGQLPASFTALTTSIGLSVVMQQAIQSLKAFKRVVVVVFCTAMFCVLVAFHQGFQPFQCVVITPDPQGEDMQPLTEPDGRPCERVGDCTEGPGGDPEKVYACEHVGLLGTTSVSSGRVRWRGVLYDPNETTLAAGQLVPFALAFFESKKTLLRFLLVVATLVVVAVTDVFSQSRGSVLIFMTVLGVYFVRKYGIRGALIGAAMAAPLLMLGGRSGEEAAESAEERMSIMSNGLQMFFSSPVIGVGYRLFTRHEHLTAHNSYVLAAAELGLFGFWVWTVIVYTVMKIMLTAFRRYRTVPGGDFVRAWSLGLFATFCGTLVGIFFLSWTYHYVLWIFFGIAGGFYSMLRTTDPHFRARPGKLELGALAVFDVALLVALRLYLRLKGH